MNTVALSLFENVAANQVNLVSFGYDQFVETISHPGWYAEKRNCPLLKLARFGDKKTKRGSLKHDGNVIAITGVEGDYDGGETSIVSAAGMLKNAGVNAVLYTSASHTPDKPRWRVLAPFSRELGPDKHAHYVAALNGVLGGILSPESFTLSQSYYYGEVGNYYETIMVDETPIDLIPGLVHRAIGPQTKTSTRTQTVAAREALPEAIADLRSALNAIRADDRDKWIAMGCRLYELGDVGRGLWLDWSATSERHDPVNDPKVWDTLSCDRSGYEAVFAEAQRAGWLNPRKSVGVQKKSTATDVELELSILCAANIQPEPIDWTWDGYLARGMFQILAGSPGVGKSTIALSFAATISSGGHWPDGTRAKQGGVVIWTGEDAVAQTLIPRLMAMNAELDNVYFVDGVATEDGRRCFDPAIDVSLLELAMRKLPDVNLLIVDPIVSAVTSDNSQTGKTRRDLQPLVDLSADHNCALLGITHFAKGTQGRSPLERMAGSLTFGAQPRIAFAAGKADEEGNPNIFVRMKSNIGPDGGGFEYQIEIDNDAQIVRSRIAWGNAIEGTALDLLAKCEVDEFTSEVNDAAMWLEAELSDGPVAVKDLQRLARESGHAWPTVKRAKKALNVQSEKAAFSGGWRWFRPNCPDENELMRSIKALPPKYFSYEGDHSPTVDPLRDTKELKPTAHNGFTEGDQV